MNPSTDKERRWLNSVGNSIRDLLALEPDPRLQLIGEEVIDVDDTGGISSRIGAIPIRAGLIELFAMVDGFSGRRLPWIGMLVPGHRLTMQIHQNLVSHGERARVVPDARMVYVNDAWRMNTPLRRTELRKPIVELYAGQDRKGIGAYFPAPRTYAVRPSVAFAKEAAEFAKELTVAVGVLQHGISRHGAQNKLLKRAIVSTTTVHRDFEQARAAKKRDDYTCRICGFRPEAVYGAHGRGCLEAHHLDEVGGKIQAQSQLNRIITLCANCHRVVHRLPTEERKLTTLRRRFAQRL